MGDRSVITIVSREATVSLYGHHSGTTNLEAVEAVLARTDRIGDPAYLTAQLFYEFAVVRGGYDGNLGFGIFQGDDDGMWLDNETVIVDAETGEYCITGQESITTYAKPYPAMGKAVI